MAFEEVRVNRGVVARARNGRIGGKGSTKATADRPARVQLALIPKDGDTREVVLGEGDTFELGGDTYQVAEIKHHSTWTVTLRLVQ
ncbi:DUF6406 domain-containing protein [Streptomyces sp. A012304]|uniref:DUF6406 domain-containing protein n=1 Tax=Streptomyces sp. A012304 TaxID=375446 RepID=UPI002230629C|nr:DUF6406 domain-containing protein [Streptomyces sp. A012304]GKQ39097.1 hypothetical protein ALMP_56260 [Streptomyces sp. A012304]